MDVPMATGASGSRDASESREMARGAQSLARLGGWAAIAYLGRLIVLDPNSPLILAPAGLAGIVVSPIWYAGVGRELLRRTTG